MSPPLAILFSLCAAALWLLYMRRGMWVALVTLREALGDLGYWLSLGLFGFLVMILPWATVFGLGREFQMVLAMVVDSTALAAVFLVVALAMGQSARERRSRALHLLLTKPISRGEVLAGKLAGTMMAVGLAVVVLAVVGTVALILAENNKRFDRIDLWPENASAGQVLENFRLFYDMHLSRVYAGILLGFFKALVVATFVVAASVYLSTGGTALVGVCVYTAGHLVEYGALSVLGVDSPWSRLFRVALPNLSNLDAWDAAGEAASAGLVATAALWAILYSTLVFSAGIIIFERHEPG